MTGNEFWVGLKSWLAKYFIFLAIAAIALSLSYLSFRKSYSVEQKFNNYSAIISDLTYAKIDSSTIDSLRQKITGLRLEQETYTNMLDRQSDWFILYVTLLFVIISIFGFIISQKTVSDVKAKNTKHYNRQKKIHDNLLVEFNELKFIVYTGEANASVTIADVYGKTDFLVYFFHSIRAAAYNAKAISVKREKTDFLTIRVKSNLDRAKKAIMALNEQPDLLLKFKTERISEYSTTRDFLRELLSFSNEEVKMMCMEIELIIEECISSAIFGNNEQASPLV
mgnify:CR=1 FL=1